MRFARALLSQSLYANSLWLLLAQGFNYFFGFLFWLVAARFYSPADVGISAALLPAAAMVAFIGTLGLGTSIIRFLSSAHQGGPALANQVFTTVTAAAAVLTAGFVLGLDLWSPKLGFIRQQPEYLMLFSALVFLTALQAPLAQTFVATRHSGYALTGSLVHGVGRVAGALTTASLVGGLGIVFSWTLALALSVGLSLFVFLPRALPGYRLQPQIHPRLFREIGAYSLANYVADGLWSVPPWVLPLIFVNLLGPEQNAYFAVTWVVAMLPFTVPQAIGTAMFAEGSYHPVQMGAQLLRSLKLCGAMLGPLVLALLLVGDKLLLLYGESYATAGRLLLPTAALAVAPATLTILYMTIARIQQWLRQIILLSGAVALGTLLITFVLVGRLGILAAGVGLLSTHTLIALVLLPRIVQLVRATAEQQVEAST